ncbi:MAG: hypothetical protein IKL07_04160 [Clostridium sp.]|nr:hypothetical protein [Clostridium sp.]
MKKFGKFLATAFTLAAVLGGAYYVYQNFVKGTKEETDDFDDFEDFEDFDDFDGFDDFEQEDHTDSKTKTSSSREYVTLDIENRKTTSKETEASDENHEDVTVFDLNSDEQ